MKTPCKELKRISRENLCRHYQVPMTIFLIIWAISGLLQLPFKYLQQTYPTDMQLIVYLIAMILIGLILSVLETGALKMHLCMARRQEYSILQTFYGFRNQPDRYVLCGLVRIALFLAALLPAVIGFTCFFLSRTAAAAWAFALLCAVSGILAVFVILQTQLLFYIALERGELPVPEVFRTAVRLMKGQRCRLLYIYLSFLGMLALCVLSLGLGFLWFIPYEKQTMANFYLDVTGELQAIQGNSRRESQTRRV